MRCLGQLSAKREGPGLTWIVLATWVLIVVGVASIGAAFGRWHAQRDRAPAQADDEGQPAPEPSASNVPPPEAVPGAASQTAPEADGGSSSGPAGPTLEAGAGQGPNPPRAEGGVATTSAEPSSGVPKEDDAPRFSDEALHIARALGEPLLDDDMPVDLHRMLVQANRMAPLSAEIEAVLPLLDNPSASAEDIAEAIEGYPRLARSLLRLVNTAMLGQQESGTDLRAVIVKLGSDTVRLLVLALGALALPETAPPPMHLLKDRLITQAAAARVVAGHVDDLPADLAFLIALLSDLGQLSLRRVFGSAYDELWRHARAAGVSAAEIEEAWLGFSHAEVSEALAESWGFSTFIVACVRHHHEPLPLLAQYDEGAALCVAATRLATTLADVIHELAPIEAGEAEALLSHEAQAYVQLSPEICASLLDESHGAGFELGMQFGL